MTAEDRMAELEARVLWLERAVREGTRLRSRPHYLRTRSVEPTQPAHYCDSTRLDASADNATGDAP
jgi:hypothetical protein